MTLRFEDHRAHAEVVIQAALRAADPAAAVAKHFPTDLPEPRKLKLLAIGKASLEMAQAACECLSKRFGDSSLAGGIVTAVPERATPERAAALKAWNVDVYAADHPLATERNLDAAKHVEQFLQSCTPDEALLVLISGGGSAHLASPVPGVSLAELIGVSSSLMRSGATIAELNAVRKHLERLKGGRCALLANAGRVVVLVLSDVIGDRLDTISSGPFAPDATTFAGALAIVNERVPQSPPSVRALLEAGTRGDESMLAETPKAGHPAFGRVSHHVVASNAAAAQSVARALERDGIRVFPPRLEVQGEAAVVAVAWVSECLSQAARENRSRPIAFVLGGETTVSVNHSKGKGGPSQEFALAAAQALASANLRNQRAVLVAFSTDGVDGPTDAAGAIVTHATWDDIARTGVDPAAALAIHDSHRALDKVGALIRTGPTGTNVNHVAVLILYTP